MLMPRWNDPQDQIAVDHGQPNRQYPASAWIQTQQMQQQPSNVPNTFCSAARSVQPRYKQKRPPVLADPEQFPSLSGSSKAVPIRRPPPLYGDQAIYSTSQKHPARPSSSLRDSPGADSHLSSVQDGSNGRSSDSRHNTSPDSSLHELNVFAKPFVSEALSIINELKGHVIDTLGVKEINFEIYVGRCLGWEFLPIVPRPIDPPSIPSTVLDSLDLTDITMHESYEYYFRAHLEAEIECQKTENKAYALFGHSIKSLESDRNGTTCSILVPGLRENSPYVEEDDIIQLRELVYDRNDILFGMEHWMSPESQFYGNGMGSMQGGRWRGEPAPGWTGTIYNARVLAVQRKDNVVVVRIDGRPYMGEMFGSSPRFNVQFPVPMKRYQPMKEVLPIIQEVLRQANRSRCQSLKGHAVQSQVTSSSSAKGSDGGADLKSLINTPWLQSILFPVEEDCDTQAKLNPYDFKKLFFDGQLNREQKRAIESVSSRDYGTLPFLVSGPPGTGKTKTLVEIALQLVKRSKDVSHVLFCAPSDPAADMIVQRLSSHFNRNELLRLNRSSRPFAEVPGGVLPFCCICEDRFDLPKFQQIMACKLVITTCRDAALLLHSRLSNVDLIAAEYGLRCSINPDAAAPEVVDLHWTALLIDEAAQAMEPEALIPLAIIAPPAGSAKFASQPLVIMAGDEHQFGPRTSLASSPLKTSLFARLFARPVYSEHRLSRGKSGERQPEILRQNMLPMARPAFANLIRNYRSHPAILAVPSAQYYFDTLVPEADNTECLSSWAAWRRPNWPVLFHNNQSTDSMDLKNGGWSNAGEAQLACEYAASLVKSGLVAQRNICIMSPFKVQVARLRSIVRDARFALWDVDIGPTEAFQGLERTVVILCTTRSQQQFVESDVLSNQGIIKMPKTMNVALTRAKFGLIVIGKQSVLVSDPDWRAFVEFCGRNGLVAGEEESEEDECRSGNGGKDNIGQLTRLEKVLLDREERAKELQKDENENERTRALGVYPQEDPMWIAGVQAELEADHYEGSDHDDDDGRPEDEYDYVYDDQNDENRDGHQDEYDEGGDHRYHNNHNT